MVPARAARRRPDPEGDRYVWSDAAAPANVARGPAGHPAWVPSPGPRPGWYLKNFYDEQPALNFGWATVRDGEPWRDAVDATPARGATCRRSRTSWRSGWTAGVAGFRIDMAFSLVKDDAARTAALS